MSTAGVIVEYNPLHNGHLYHLQLTRKITGADAIVAIMSGHFLQRGEPALADKWARAQMALQAGCDLVIELPVAYSAQPAEWFAYGAVALLEATGVVDSLCFGSESGDLTALSAAAELLADPPPEFAHRLNTLLKQGNPYPSAYAAAAADYFRACGREELLVALSEPNHTLGLHYLLALRTIRSRIKPFSIKREKSGYSQQTITDASIASATALRKLLLKADSASTDVILRGLTDLAAYVPHTTLAILEREVRAGRAPIHWEHFARPLFHELLRQSPADLAAFAEVSEGLEHRILKSAATLSELSVAALLDAIKTKRYTRTKLQRTLLRMLLGHRKDMLSPERLATGIDYIRVLGFTPRGQQLLHRMRIAATVPVVLSAAKSDSPYLALDARATAVYSLAFRRSSTSDRLRDFTQPPIRE